MNSFQFEQQIRSFDTLGYARDPTATQGTKYVGDVEKVFFVEGPLKKCSSK